MPFRFKIGEKNMVTQNSCNQNKKRISKFKSETKTIIKISDSLYAVGKTKNLFEIKLKLASQTRHIGWVDNSGEGTYITQRKSEHIFKKLNAFCIGYELVHQSIIPYNKIVVIHDNQKFLTTRNYLIHNGIIVLFINKGYELQLALPIKQFNLKTALEWEKKNISIQCELFGEVA